jgi:hypothetical protein
VKADAPECGACGAAFGANAAWQPLESPPPPRADGRKLLKFVGLSVLALPILLYLLLVVLSSAGLGGTMVAYYLYAVTIGGTKLDNWLRESRPTCAGSEEKNLLAYINTGIPCRLPSGESHVPKVSGEIANSRRSWSGQSRQCPVEYAIKFGTPDGLQALLQSGADPAKCPGSADTLFELFLQRSRNGGGHRFAYALHDAGFRPSDPKAFLFNAAQLGSAPGVEYVVLRMGQSVDATDADGRTPLYHAILASPTVESFRTVGKLVELGADPDHASVDGESPMQKGRRVYAGTKWDPTVEHNINWYMKQRKTTVFRPAQAQQ